MRRAIQFLALLFPLLMGGASNGQNVKSCTYDAKNAAGKSVPCNGISVGPPKVFDNRALTLQLQKLKKQLDQQQAQSGVIDLKSLAAALNNLQGLSQQETSTALSVTGSPTPATSLTSTLATGNADANGNPLPDTTNTQKQTTTSSVSPSTPSFDSFATLPAGFNPTFGPSASDLLNDQVSLSYQIINLQMLLDRALSDRVYPQTATGDTRLQTVLGFNVTLDPPRTANDAVAVVEITLTPDPAGDVSLVALMPQEKTYNAAALSSKSNVYSGAAMAGAFQVSGGVRKRSQVFYLYKDLDTISYQRMTADGKLVFGWMFRPVLGRRSVPPGFRQLFAVLALPAKDCVAPSASDDACAIKLMPRVRTYWKKYDRNTQTGFEEDEANRARKVWYGVSLGTAKPQLFYHAGYENDRNYGAVRIGSTNEYQRQLTPTVSDIEWRPTGNKTVSVSVEGNNFFTDTQVLLGDNRYSETAGNMAIKSDQSFELTSTLDQVASGSGVIQGRYGLSTPLISTGPRNCQGACAFGVVIDKTEGPTLTESMGGTRRLTVVLQALADPQKLVAAKTDDEKEKLRALTLSNLPTVTNSSLTGRNGGLGYTTQTPVLSINGTAVPFPYDIVQPIENGRQLERIQISANVSDTLLTETSAAVINIAWPFYDPAKWSTSIPYSPVDAQFKVVRVSDKTVVLSRINGAAFVPATVTSKHCWTLVATDKPLSFGTSDCIASPVTPAAPKKKEKIDKKKTEEKKIEDEQPVVTPISSKGKPIFSFLFTVPPKFPAKAVLIATNGTIYRLDIPEIAEKKDTTTKITTLQQYDSAWIDISYPASKVPVRVETNGLSLNWRIDPPDPKAKSDAAKAAKTKDKTMHVEITRTQTAKPGLLDVVVFDKTQAQIAKLQVRITCTLCGDGGEK